MVEVAEGAPDVEAVFGFRLSFPPRLDRFGRLREMLDDGVVVAEFSPFLAHLLHPVGEDVAVLVHQIGRERRVAEVAETDGLGVSVGDCRRVVETRLQIEVHRRRRREQ